MNGVLTYRNYHGSVNYSVEDDCLYGQIIGINDMIMFEGKSIDELREDFESAVD